MGAILIALLPILQGLLAGTAVGTVLGGLTVGQWVAIAAALLTLETPEIESQITKLHPAFDKLLADAKQFGPQVAAENAVAFDFEKPSNAGMFDFLWGLLK
jgi:hypothetical protein